jgi:hypothetical protein
MPRPLALMAALALAGCASFGQSNSCLLPLEKPMVEARLFFGRDIAGRGPVTDAEWAGFAESVLSKEFPDGFTAMDGEGQWRDPQSGHVVREPSKIVLIAAEESPAFASRLRDVMDDYRARFHQQSVGVITRAVCAAF